MFEVSVIICSHNPRHAYFKRVLQALAEQSLPKERWELLVVDNNCNKRLEMAWDIRWHPHGQHIREERIGKTNALLTGIIHARSELLVIVDDDNVLEPDYLEAACLIAREFPQIGAFGGSLIGEFETKVPDWAKPYLEGLAVNAVLRDRWSNDYSWSDAVPYGAGMCVRNIVAQRYRAEVKHNRLRKELGPSGVLLTRADDLDLAWTAIDVGLGTGRFRSLKAVHLIPAERLTQEYLVRLSAGFSYSNVILWAVRGLKKVRTSSGWRDRLRHGIAFLRLRGVRRRVYFASREAANSAWRMLDGCNN